MVRNAKIPYKLIGTTYARKGPHRPFMADGRIRGISRAQEGMVQFSDGYWLTLTELRRDFRRVTES